MANASEVVPTLGGNGVRGIPAVLLAALFSVSGLAAQALSTGRTDGGTEILLITHPLAEQTAACWPDSTRKEDVYCIRNSNLLFDPTFETALNDMPSPPPVLIIVGGPGRRDVFDLIRRVEAGRETTEVSSDPDSHTVPPTSFGENLVERRLSAPGSASVLRLEIPLPPASDPGRSALECFWRFLPGLLGNDFPEIRARIDGSIGIIETGVDAARADTRLSTLRLALARISGDPELDPEEVRAESQRLLIARAAALETPTIAAEELVRRWLSGGRAGVREYLFGIGVVDFEAVRHALRTWLARHPGRALISLPPRVFQPRFAPAPRVETLENDLNAAILERPEAGLSALVMRPVLLSGITGDAEAVVLTRLGARIRALGFPVPRVTVSKNPPRIELIGADDDFPLLVEALQAGLDAVVDDDSPLPESLEVRDRALRLLGRFLSLNSGGDFSAREILAPENLVIGAVAPDVESAMEALVKFGIGGSKQDRQPVVSSISGSLKHREATAGSRSAIAISLEYPGPWPVPVFLEEIFSQRAGDLWPDFRFEVFRPLVPGRDVTILLIEGEAGVRELEESVRKGIDSLLAPVDENTMEELRRRVSRKEASVSDGVSGRARICAETAAGLRAWSTPASQQMKILGMEPDSINTVLEHMRGKDGMQWTAAGPMALKDTSE